MKYLKIPMDKIINNGDWACPGHIVKGEQMPSDCEKLECSKCSSIFLKKYTIEEDESVTKFECTACSTKPCKVEVPKGDDYHEPLNCLYQDNVKTNWKEV